MYKVAWWASLVFLCLGQGSVRAQTRLEFELEETCYLEVRHKARQEIKVIGRTRETETTLRFLFKVRPVKVGRAGTVLEHTVVACEDVSTTKGGPTEKGTFKGLKGQQFRVLLGPGNRTLELAGTDKLVEPVFGADAKKGTANEKRFFADMLNAVLRVHLIDAYMPVPDKAVSAGDKWRNTTEVKVYPITQAKLDRTYSLLGRQIHEGQEVEAVGWTSLMQYTLLKDDAGVLPFKIKEMKELDKGRYDGTVLWGRSVHRPLRVDCIQSYKLSLVMLIQGKEVKAEGAGNDSFVIRFLKDKPEDAGSGRLPPGGSRLKDQLEQLNREHLALLARKDRKGAAENLKKMLDVLNRLYPAEDYPNGHKEIASVLNRLGYFHSQQGDIRQALAWWERALKMRQRLYPRKKFPDGHEDLLISLNRFGGALVDAGRVTEALVYQEQAVEMARRLYASRKDPAGHNRIAEMLYVLGNTQEAAKQYARALSSYTDALAMQRRLSPPERFPAGHKEIAETLNQLGRMYFLTGRPKEAIPIAEEALALHRKLHPAGHPQVATMLTNLAHLKRVTGDAQGAGVLFLEASDLLEKLANRPEFRGAAKDWATSFMHPAELLEKQKEHDKALALYRRGLAASRKVFPHRPGEKGSPFEGYYLRKVAKMLETSQQYDAAATSFEEALVFFRRLYPEKEHPNGEENINFIQNRLATIYTEMGLLEKVRLHVDQAMAMAEKLYPPAKYPNGHPILATIIFNKGMLELNEGQAALALPYLERALAMRRKLAKDSPENQLYVAISLRGLAGAYKHLGQSGKALTFLREAEKVLTRQGVSLLDKEMIDLQFNLADALYEAGDSTNALIHELSAVNFLRKLYPRKHYPNGHLDLANAFVRLGGRMVGMGKSWHSRAEKYFDEAFAIYTKLYPPEQYPRGHPSIATAFVYISRLDRALGRPEEALRHARLAVRMMENIFPRKSFPDGHPLLADALSNLGDIYFERGKPLDALPYYERALAMQQFSSGRLAADSSETEALYALQERSSAKYKVLSASYGRPELDARVYGFVWQTKAAQMRLLRTRHLAARIARDKDPGVRDDWAKLLRVRRDLGRLVNMPARDKDEHEKALQKLTDEKESLERSLVAALRKKGLLEDDLARLTPQGLAKALPPKSAFVDILAYSRRQEKGPRWKACYVAFLVVPGGGVRRIELGEASPIDEAVAAWRGAIEKRKEEAVALGLLARRLWRPIFEHLPRDTRTLYLSPDSDLTRLPWVALPGAAPNTVLLDDYEGGVGIVPHGPFLLGQLRKERAGDDRQGRVLAVGNVAYGPEPGEGAERFWKELRWSGSELRHLRAAAGDRPVAAYDREGATAEAVIKTLTTGEVRYAHFATHGQFDEEAMTAERQRVRRARRTEKLDLGRTIAQPSAALRSRLAYTSLVLAGANEVGKDRLDAGYLTGEAIINLPLEKMRLAVLSACDTGLGDLTEGEGVFGLQRAFHVAGCENVIGSLWRVDDAATAALMAKFYHALWKEGKPPLAALRVAQLTILRHPELVPDLAGQRGPIKLAQAVKVPVPPARPAAPDKAGKSSVTKLWAAFFLSGVGN
jgi:tetratricopeptide (TPR) repeat protein